MRRCAQALVLGGCVALAACSGGGGGNAVVVPQAVGGTGAAPIPTEQIDAAVAKLDELVADIMRRSNIPGMAVAVVKDGRTIYAKGFGVRRVGSPERVDADTVFQLASMSKPIGATVVAGLVGRGTVSWDTPVVSKLAGFSLADASVTQRATIGDFYAHRSGLHGGVGDDLEGLGYDRQQILQRLRYAPLLPFRTRYNYANFGMTVGGEAAAVASGLEWATLSERTLYQPLGMNATSSRFADFMQRDNRASPHVLSDGRYQALHQRQPDAQSPAGGASSSVNDLAHWMSMVLQNGTYQGRPVVKAEALRPAISPQIVSSPAANASAPAGHYGYGFVIGTSSSGRVKLAHSGAFMLGAATSFSMIPSAGVAIVTLTNAAPVGAPEAVNASFDDLVEFGQVKSDWLAVHGAAFAKLYAIEGSLVDQQPPAQPVAPLGHNAYTGTYANSFYGNAMVESSGSGLVLKMGPGGARVFALRHWNGNSFVFDFPREIAEPGALSRIDFKPGVSGLSDSLQIEYYAEDIAGGVFTKTP
ncbi:serine hydrolase [Variovorax sp. M-6]|uniref:serine hydrolase n=1 Tax=Variovorax sp. M-6 TaxID=3233041 RepID=UPI003F95B8AA